MSKVGHGLWDSLVPLGAAAAARAAPGGQPPGLAYVRARLLEAKRAKLAACKAVGGCGRIYLGVCSLIVRNAPAEAKWVKKMKDHALSDDDFTLLAFWQPHD